MEFLGKKAALVEMPQGYGDFHHDWEIWLAVALAHGVP
jgi:hypothetical protein